MCSDLAGNLYARRGRGAPATAGGTLASLRAGCRRYIVWFPVCGWCLPAFVDSRFNLFWVRTLLLGLCCSRVRSLFSFFGAMLWTLHCAGVPVDCRVTAEHRSACLRTGSYSTGISRWQRAFGISFTSPFSYVARSLVLTEREIFYSVGWWCGCSSFLSPFAGLALFLLGFPHGLRRGLHSFAASRLGPAGFRPFAALRLGGRGV